MKIGAIVRSVSERTKNLCVKSLEQGLPKDCVKVVEGVSPFIKTLKQCYTVAIDEGFDWYLLVDADMVMVESWKKLFGKTLEEIKDKERVWEFTFRLSDSIEGRNIDAIHVVKGAYSEELLKSVDLVSDGLKPEGKVRDNMISRTGAKRVITKNVIAYHGVEQYYKDIYNRFYNRACRDKKYAIKNKLFRNINSEDKKVAQSGFEAGLKDIELKSLDFRSKISIDIKEKSHIRFGLNTFYKRVKHV